MGLFVNRVADRGARGGLGGRRSGGLSLSGRGPVSVAATAWATGMAIALAVVAPPVGADVDPRATPAQAAKATLDYGLRARVLADGVWVVEGAVDDFTVDNGCNIINTGFIATDAGILVVNTGPSRIYGEQLRALIRRTTGRDATAVVHLNLHPDYFLGNQAFADLPRWASAVTAAGIRREAASYETNLFRLCGDWMKGTETVLPDRDLGSAIAAGQWTVGGRVFELVELQGHTDSDLVLVDRRSGVVFAGGLVFARRVPTTPHAKVEDWIRSLEQLRQRPGLSAAWVVPSHGPVHRGAYGAAQTQDFLRWLDAHFRRAATEGWDMNDLLQAPVPAPFRDWAAFRTEYVRNVAHLYPVYEKAALRPGRR